MRFPKPVASNTFVRLFIAAVALLVSTLRAAEITSLSATLTGTDNVIASDASNNSPLYNRDGIPVEVTVGLTGTPFTEPMRDFRVRFRLLRDDGQEVPLADGSQYSNVINWPTSYSASLPPLVQGGIPLPASVTFTGRPVPNARLDVNRNYRVEAQVQRWQLPPSGVIGVIGFQNIGNPVQTGLRRFFHFTNTVSDSPERNVIAYMGTANYSRRFAITSSPNQKGFLVNAPYTLRRYDAYSSLVPTDSTPVELVWNVKLYRETGLVDVEVPLFDDSSFRTQVTIPHFVEGSPRTPAVASGTAVLHLRPSVQLDSREQSYARLTLSHRELPAPAAPVDSNTTNTSTSRLLHFNGFLDFGTIRTTIEEIAGNPLGGAVLEAGSPAPSVLCSPQITTGRLPEPNTSHTYSGTLAVRLLPNGTAVYHNPDVNVSVTPPTVPDKDRDNGVAFVRASISLSTTGASSVVAAIVPPGMTVTPRGRRR